MLLQSHNKTSKWNLSFNLCEMITLNVSETFTIYASLLLADYSTVPALIPQGQRLRSRNGAWENRQKWTDKVVKYDENVP